MKKNRIRKIVLCGATSVEETNFGDVLLEELLVEKIKSIIPDVSISRFKRHDTLRNYIWRLVRTDAFIYVPGGYLGYIEKWYSGSFAKSLQRLIYYYLPGLLYSFTGKPMVLLGQGIGPYEYRVLSGALKRIANYSALVTVRDTESYELLRKVGCSNKISITADCSQVLLKYNLIWECAESKKIKSKKGQSKVMFVLFFNTQQWKNKVIEALKPFMGNDYLFVITTDGINTDRKDFLEFTRSFPEDKTFAFDYKSPEQLLSVLNETDIVITPKLHTGIVSCVLGKSVFAFAAQYDKTKIYYNRIGYPERACNLDKVSASEMTRLIEKYENEKIKLPEEIIEAAEQNYTMLEQFFK